MKDLKMNFIVMIVGVVLLTAWSGVVKSPTSDQDEEKQEITEMQKKLNTYVPFKLTADISHLSRDEKEMLQLLFQASKLMNDIFWKQNVGDKNEFLKGIDDEHVKSFARINYGAWDEMDDLKPFVDGYGEKPAGAEFYPHDMTKEEFEAFDDPDKTSLYTLIRRNGVAKFRFDHKG